MMNKREAKRAGADAGRNAATWVFDGNTSDETFLSAAVGILVGDPEVMDRIGPRDWLSGEWAGESLSELDLEPDEDERLDDRYDVQGIQDAYVEAADAAYWKQLEKEIPRRIWTKAKRIAARTTNEGARSAVRKFGNNPAKFTRQDFQLIADIISALPRELATEPSRYNNGHSMPWTRSMVAFHFAERLGITNSRFDETRFLRACGVDAGEATGNRRRG